MSFAIVEWLGTDPPSVSAVPCSWLVLEDGDRYSYWPPAGERHKGMKTCGAPKCSWLKHIVRTLGKASKNLI